MSGGGSQPAGNTTTTQTTTPWSGQQPYLSQELGAAQGLYQNYTPQYYPGQQVAPLTPYQTQAETEAANIGAAGGTSAVNAANNYETQLMNGAYLDPTKNPNWNSMAQNVLSSTVPGLEAQFTQGNNMNNPGAAYAVSQGANDALGGLAAQQYGNTLGLMSQGVGYQGVPGLQGANLNAIGALSGAGSEQQAQAQNAINAQIAKYNYGQTLPYNQLNTYLGEISGNYGNTSSLTSPYFQQQTGGLNGALGGAASGAALGTAVAPGYGTLAGGVLGALYGGLS
jgi:hypothetical protein